MAAQGNNNNPAGRPKGAVNKVNAKILDDVLAVYDRMGGVDGLYKWVMETKRNTTAFYGWLMSKRLPSIQDVRVGNADEEGFRVTVEKVLTDKRPAEGADE